MKRSLALLLFATVILSSCLRNHREYGNEKVPGYKPVFSNNPDDYIAKSLAPQPIKNPGKIYVKDNLLFQSDEGYGIHVIDKTDPAKLKNIGFIRIIGNSDMSIKGNYMYVNSITDLVVVDISNWQNVKEVKRMENVFQAGQQSNFYGPMIPLAEKGAYYECQNLYRQGYVQIGWVKDSVMSYCRY